MKIHSVDNKFDYPFHNFKIFYFFVWGSKIENVKRDYKLRHAPGGDGREWDRGRERIAICNHASLKSDTKSDAEKTKLN